MPKPFYERNTELIERIKSVMQEERMKASIFAEKMGYQRGNLSRIINGQRPAPDSLIDAICNVYEVSKEWLLTGKGEMHNQEPEPPKQDETLTAIASLINELKSEREEIRKERQILLDMMQKLTHMLTHHTAYDLDTPYLTAAEPVPKTTKTGT